MGRVILIVVDGLRYDTAVDRMGYLEGLVHDGAASRYRMRCGLPSKSRPLYETIHTGLSPHEHGITSNDVVRPSTSSNIFQVAHDHGRTTAAAAYFWMSELYLGTPYDPHRHREVDEGEGVIHYGRFYVDDAYPDGDLFEQADILVERRSPDFMLIHPMGCDYQGHEHGGESVQYRRQAATVDNLLSQLMPKWRHAGYEVIVTSDHGMDAHGHHGGTYEEVMMVPCYHVGESHGPVPADDAVVDQRAVAPTVLTLMDLPRPVSMRIDSLV